MFAITNSSGAFDSSAFTDLQNVNLVADDNSGNAIDTATGLPLTLTMSAPGSYQVITPITTLIAAISGKGYSLDAAEEIVSSAFQLNNSIDFSTFDPFGSSATPQTEVAEAYQVLAMKVANIIMASDGDFQVNSFAGYTEAVARFADLVILKNNLSQTVDLTDLNQLRQLLPSADEDLLATLQTSNGVNSFNELLDSQLVLQSANSLGQIQLPTGDGTVLVAVEISGILSDSDVYRLTLENADGSVSVSSSEVVSLGTSVVVFVFSKEDIRSVDEGGINLSLDNLSTGSSVQTVTTIEVTEQAAAVSGGGGGSSGGAATPTESGVVADGYISGARVFRDEDEDGVYDAGETYVTTNSSGQYTGLGGSMDKPIVADGNNGTAIDTSTGIVFNAVLSAPAGSKVVNPITTVINELIKGDATLKANYYGDDAASCGGTNHCKWPNSGCIWSWRCCVRYWWWRS